jgi:hypothetical protein
MTYYHRLIIYPLLTLNPQKTSSIRAAKQRIIEPNRAILSLKPALSLNDLTLKLEVQILVRRDYANTKPDFACSAVRPSGSLSN